MAFWMLLLIVVFEWDAFFGLLDHVVQKVPVGSLSSSPSLGL